MAIFDTTYDQDLTGEIPGESFTNGLTADTQSQFNLSENPETTLALLLIARANKLTASDLEGLSDCEIQFVMDMNRNKALLRNLVGITRRMLSHKSSNDNILFRKGRAVLVDGAKRRGDIKNSPKVISHKLRQDRLGRNRGPRVEIAAIWESNRASERTYLRERINWSQREA